MGSASVSQHMLGLLEWGAALGTGGQSHRLLKLSLGESVCLRPGNSSQTATKNCEAP